MPDNVDYVLADDIELIKEQLRGFQNYDFIHDLQSRMTRLSFSQSELARRAKVSHAMVGRWLKGARPHGKERLKELGMALAMDETQLNIFLCANCYPRLYAKNPLDLVCRFIMNTCSGSEEIVNRYRNMLEQYGLSDYVPASELVAIPTAEMSMDFAGIKSLASFEAWLIENDKHFSAFDKTYIANVELVRFVLMYINGQSINEMYVAGELPVTIKNLLYPLTANKEIAVKGFRAKLIVFGLYENMAEDEIDLMLEVAKLQLLSEPVTLVDNALLTMLRCAHQRYPYFELNNAKRILQGFAAEENPELYALYQEKERKATDFVKYYESGGHKSELERLFEENYTDYADKGILHYVTDILAMLIKDDMLGESEAGEYLTLMQNYRSEI